MLVARYTVPAHRAAFLLGAGDEADDVVQEALVKAFRHLSRFRVGEPFGPWLLRIVANETKNLTRSRRRRAELAVRLSALKGDADSRDGGPGPVGAVLAGERRGALLKAVDALSDKERQAVVCRYFLELSEAETAQVLGWPRGSVKSRTFRALTKLRGLLGEVPEADAAEPGAGGVERGRETGSGRGRGRGRDRGRDRGQGTGSGREASDA
ncbi:MAG TPA: RNA polymerase sigma factor [Streptosporangiaceae bacterium]|nr:RNA polymerase sigma factor [Streptosporangiaceae bacterium]